MSLAIAEQVRGRDRTATEVLEEHLEKLAADELGAVWRVTEERARREAAAVDRALAEGRDPGPLAGVPVGWKDLIDTGGITTTYGSALFRDHVPDRDADVVARLAAAGAVTVAKLATHELAWGTTTQNPHFGSCKNPHDPTRVPGGSSGGSAAALASGMVAAAPGTDTGGSIRCPASCCGIVGLKPTFGRVSLAGIRMLCPTLDHCGPMARTVRDCALQLEVMAGASPRDPRTSPVPVERWSEAAVAAASRADGRRRRALLLRAHRRRHRGVGAARQSRRCATPGREIVEVDMRVADHARRSRPVHARGGGDAVGLLARPAGRLRAGRRRATSSARRGPRGGRLRHHVSQYRLEYARAHARDRSWPPGST